MKPVTLAQKRVLVVDDNPINLEILEKMLEKVAMEVITLTRGTDVIPYLKDAIAKNNIIDIAVLDIEIPDMDGYSIAAAIREPNQQFPSIPLVALSSVMKRDAQKCETAGFNGFLSKPVRPDKLYQMLERLLAETSGTQIPSSERKAKIHTQYSVREDIKQSICILLAEDNPVNQKLAVMMLGKAGYKVEVAVNGIEAVEKYSAAPENFDLIFMDVQMPEMDGVAASQSLRQKGFDKVPIVAMTANAMKGDREKCLAAGMNDYMTKPIKREKVFEMVEKWCFMPPSYFQ
jgi:CheY-like chemotaxis protein